MTPRLWRFPIFWIGLALLSYVTIQALNPSWRYMQNEEMWWLVRVPDIPWLPTSVDVPFVRSNAWRQLVIYGSAWLVVCSMWVGVTRRRSIRILLGVLMANAVALSGLLVFQRATGNLRIPWPLTELTKADLAATFISRNHTGAYLALTTFSAVALATWGYDQGARTLKKSTPAAVLILVTFFLIGAVLFTFSRGGALSLAAALGLFGVWFFLRRRYRPAGTSTDYRITVALTVIFGVFLLYVGRNLDFSEINHRFSALLDQQSVDDSVSTRLQARSAALSMLSDHWLRGVGAGGFRHRFPRYARNYPEIDRGGELFWEHAHNDWLEIPIELGLTGTVILLAGAGCAIGALVRGRRQWHSAMVPLLFGCVATLLHAFIDFPFQCPAILVTWCLLLTIACRMIGWSDDRMTDDG
jgi:O-antigen ligase